MPAFCSGTRARDGRGVLPAAPTRRCDVRVIVPALNESSSLPSLLRSMPSFVSDVLVVDNGSSDDTAGVARAHGARVVREARRGYGRACLTGIDHVGECDILVFVDADSAGALQSTAALIAPIASGDADFVLGTRRGSAALSVQQRAGNGLACFLMRALWGACYTDLGPFRAITPAALRRLDMRDEDFGWTVEMQIRAAVAALRVVEVAVEDSGRSEGRSKISGTLAGVCRAGAKILYVIAREAVRDLGAPVRRLQPEGSILRG